MNGLLQLLRRRDPVLVGQTPADVVARDGKWSLKRFRPRPEGLAFDTPLLLVPSLINRWYVLDLMPGKSFVEYLVEQGHDVYVIDWGTPTAEDRYVTFDDVCDRYLGRALRATCRVSGSARAHLLGYCLGGTLTTIHAAARPERVASMVALAAPIRFDDDGLLARWTRAESFDVDALVDGFGNVPWRLMQASFHMLRPTLTLSKTVTLLDRASDDPFLDSFAALETWGGDNVSLPGEFYRTYIQELYRADALVRGGFCLSGTPARLEDLSCPLLVVSFEHDNIVPGPSAAALAEHAGSKDVTHWHLPGGHVGAVVSSKARHTLWPRLSTWWAEH